MPCVARRPSDLADAVQQGSRRGREVFAISPVDRVVHLLDDARADVRHLSPPAELDSVKSGSSALSVTAAASGAASGRVRSER